MLRCLLTSLLVFYFFYPVSGHTPVPQLDISGGGGLYKAGPYLRLTKTDKVLSPKDVLLLPHTVIADTDVPNLGFTFSSYWMQLHVKNGAVPQKKLLEIAYPLIDRLEYYILSRNDTGVRMVTGILGDRQPFGQRLIRTRTFLIPVEFKPEEEKIFLFRIDGKGESVNFPVYLWSPEAYTEHQGTEQYLYGFYYGILLFVIFLTLFLIITVKERVYVYYLFYVISLGLLQFSLDGLSFKYFWPASTWWANHVIPFSGVWAVFFAIQFANAFLDLRKNHPLFHRLANGMAALLLVLLISSLLPNPFYSFTLRALNVAAFVANASIILMTVGIVKKYKPARLFLAAFIMLSIGVLSYVLKNFGIVTSNFISDHGIQLGSAVEVILLSFALADRFKILRDETQKAQALALERLQKMNQLKDEINLELERKVAERTREISTQKEIIEQKNKDITDSINYARRIQQAILPIKTEMARHFRDSFVLYKPRDIVSGDFYWFTQKDRYLFLAVADCTGHGVPGAFMSMIGTQLLNQVVIEKQVTEPPQILEGLHAGVVNSLKQDTAEAGETRDGMDIALCRIDLHSRELIFSGAYRSLYVVRHGNLEEYKGDKFPIGGTVKDGSRMFTSKKISLEEKDAIYLFTDGYIDQFGGADGKKFMSRRLRETLLKIYALPMQEQRTVLDRVIERWKGDHEQVDDILVAGILF